MNEDVYDALAKINNLIETEVPNVRVKDEPNIELNWRTTYRLTKLGFEIKHQYIPIK